MSGRKIIASNSVYKATCDAPSHRLLPVDVLSLNHWRASQDELPWYSPKQAHSKSSDIVYDCVATINSGPGEWMYELQVILCSRRV